ncbi:hypothetical protein ABNQ39_00205 (plasmid) [Azospirillum sp. A26]|uniref:phage adaptor protein n=1 Tax=Azospirillum sp. A26 TaxID=3160607 RepID=UPI003671EB46
MPYTYDSFKAAMALHMIVDATDPDFVAVLPQIIEGAEQRIYRELDPIWCRKTWASTFGSSGTPEDNATLAPPTDLLEVREFRFYPLGAGTTKRQALEHRADTFVREYWPDPAVTGTPKYYALTGADPGPLTIQVAPTPSTAAPVEIVGTFRPAALSATNTTTNLATLYPDLMLYAALVFAAGYQRNFGAQSDDPRQAMSWEQQYQGALASAKAEEARRKGGAWVDRASPSAAIPTA